MSICLLDTTVLCELLQIPSMCEGFAEIAGELHRKIRNKESFLLPMSTVLETGNHIGQNGNGRQRRETARKFVDFVQAGIRGETPFRPIYFFEPDVLIGWLTEFPDWTMRTNSRGKGAGLGDLTIVKEFERQCRLNRMRRIYIWSTDSHLSSYDWQP